MIKFLAITILGLTLGVSNSSFAMNFVDTNTKTAESQEVSTEISGGKVETSPMSFYFDPAQKATGGRQTVKTVNNDEPTLLVFGVSL